MMDPLDNPVWHALTGPHATVAEGGSRARRYRPEFTVWSALRPDPDARAWDELAAVVGEGGSAVLSGPPSEPQGWEVVASFPIVQMILDDPVTGEPDDRVEVLDETNAAAMAALTGATAPGPWADRTHELGDFYGVVDGDELVAMAGERLRLPSATEISAVCTSPERRGRGLAAALVTEVVRGIQTRGETAFLHVRSDNSNAIRVYERLGFRTRVQTGVALLRPPPNVKRVSA